MVYLNQKGRVTGRQRLSLQCCKVQCVRHCTEAVSLHLIKLIGLTDCQNKAYMIRGATVRVEEKD